ncbi:MAG: isocitrate lyase/phosphoenolpyruvate mutase family protein [Myxococcota bacterium]
MRHDGPARLRARLAQPERPLRLLQAHDALCARVVETATCDDDPQRGFDGLWISSLADSASRAQPDRELVDVGTRLASLAWILEGSSLPAVFDGDTGGWPEQAALLVRRLAQLGVAAVVFEDKAGRKRNSLAADRLQQEAAGVEEFCDKLRAAAHARGSTGPLIVARIESLIRGDGPDDAVARAHAYVEAGADAILVHGPGPTAGPVLDVVRQCRRAGLDVPVFVVPTAFPDVTEATLAEAGVDVVIYANHLLRSALAAMRSTARTLLQQRCAASVDADCVSVADVLATIEREPSR